VVIILKERDKKLLPYNVNLISLSTRSLRNLGQRKDEPNGREIWAQLRNNLLLISSSWKRERGKDNQKICPKKTLIFSSAITNLLVPVIGPKIVTVRT
jgi:hypothetical protein